MYSARRCHLLPPKRQDHTICLAPHVCSGTCGPSEVPHEGVDLCHLRRIDVLVTFVRSQKSDGTEITLPLRLRPSVGIRRGFVCFLPCFRKLFCGHHHHRTDTRFFGRQSEEALPVKSNKKNQAQPEEAWIQELHLAAKRCYFLIMADPTMEWVVVCANSLKCLELDSTVPVVHSNHDAFQVPMSCCSCCAGRWRTRKFSESF